MRARAAAWAADLEPFWEEFLTACAPYCETTLALGTLPVHIEMRDACHRLGQEMSGSTLLERARSVR